MESGNPPVPSQKNWGGPEKPLNTPKNLFFGGPEPPCSRPPKNIFVCGAEGSPPRTPNANFLEDRDSPDSQHNTNLLGVLGHPLYSQNTNCLGVKTCLLLPHQNLFFGGPRPPLSYLKELIVRGVPDPPLPKNSFGGFMTQRTPKNLTVSDPPKQKI